MLVLHFASPWKRSLADETHDAIANPELIVQEEDWVNHGKGEEDFDPEKVATWKQEELDTFEKLKVYSVLKEEELANDPKPIKIGTKWVITNKGTDIKLVSCLRAHQISQL